MYSINVEVKWSASHRLLTKEGNKFYDKNKCGSLHGHNFKAVFEFRSNILDEFGFLMDFKRPKEILQAWINQYWDHATLIHPFDYNLISFCNRESDRYYVLPEGYTTSAESMANFLYDRCLQIMADGIPLYSVTVYETETNKASYFQERNISFINDEKRERCLCFSS